MIKDGNAKNPSARAPRFWHKLNMLEPGTKMLKWAGILLAAGAALRLLKLSVPAYCLMGLAGTLVSLLLILLIVEARQDRAMNEAALRENEEKERTDRRFK